MPSSERIERSTRFVALDGVRGVAAIAVMLYHYSEFSGTPWLPRAWLAVDVFVCLSGFVISHRYQREIEAGLSLVEFMRRRLVRLYPIYLFGLLFGAAMFLATEAYPPHGYGAASFLKALALGLLVLPYPNEMVLAQGTTQATGLLFPFNGPSWSMFFELAVNVGFFALVAWGVRRLRWVLGVSALAYLWIAHAATGLNAGWNTHTFAAGFPRLAYAFAAGMAVYRWHRQHAGDTAFAQRNRLGPFSVALMLIVFMLPVSAFVSLVGVLALGPLIVWGNAAARPAPRLAATCSFLGWISYPLYLVHLPVFYALSLPAPRLAAPSWVVIVVKAGIAFAAAWSVALLDDALRRRRRATLTS
ncbi:MAG TPA: acyltransferase [Burkholderiaceae bacterium]|nr:acyltransferase [Burkholderiaceae bacterium]